MDPVDPLDGLVHQVTDIIKPSLSNLLPARDIPYDEVSRLHRDEVLPVLRQYSLSDHGPQHGVRNLVFYLEDH